MAQFKIKQVRELQSTLDSITGIDTITEAYTTTATDGPTGITITYSCRETDNAQVYVNGVRLNIGDFGWREGTTDVSSNSELNAGTELVWDSSAIGYDIGTTDEIEIIYETGIPVTIGGSVGSGSNGADGTSGTSGVDGASVNILGTLESTGQLPQSGNSGNKGDSYIIEGNLHFFDGTWWNNVGAFTGSSGTSGTSGVSGDAGTSGTSGVSNSNATGLTLTSPSGIFYEVVVDDAGNLSTNNVGTSGTSGSSPSGINLTGLIAHLDASASNSYPGTGTTWTDLTGNGHNAELQGFATPPYSTDNGGIFAWPIDATSNENIGFPNSASTFSLGNTAPLTIQMWMYIPDNGSPTLLDKYGSTGYQLSVNVNSSNNYFGLSYDGYGVSNIGGNPAVNKNAWNFLTFIFKDTQPNGNVAFDAYTNDTLTWSTALNPITSWATESSNLQIGLQTPQEWYGKIGSIFFYNRELSSTEIADNFNSTKTRFGV
jgi:hypothetical protein